MSSAVTVLADKVTTAYEALESAGLNFTVEQSEVMNVATGKVSELKKSLYRSDTGVELGVVGMGYNPVQNFDAFSYFDNICQMYGARYSQAISIDGGAKIVLKAEFPKTDLINLNDEVRRQFVLINGHNGTVGLKADFMLERLVCTNGLRMMSRDAASSFRFKHTTNVLPKMDEALKVLGEGVKYFDNFIEMSRALAQKHIDKTMVDSFLDDLIGSADEDDSKRSASMKQNKKDTLIDLYQNGMGNNGSTAWDIYNAVTEYTDHHHGNGDKRDNFNYFGGGISIKEKAFNLAISL